MIKFSKPKSLYDTFERKSEGSKVTHYCPGCGHGTVHKLLAEVIDELKIQDRTVFLSPVGCSVFGYYYFDTGNIQCSHGRAPAVATGFKRVHPESIVISYQGDGDLAGIGTTEIIHAANRGENITVIFINNAIYGMTGGQMAPTTLPGQVTATTPNGRNDATDGMPIGMSELLNSLEAPAYIERVSVSGPAAIRKTRAAIVRGLRNQIEGKGFSFIEILSPCPINWKMSPDQARDWIKSTLQQRFPLGSFRDRDRNNSAAPQREHLSDDDLFRLLAPEKELPHIEGGQLDAPVSVKISGFGGQGVLSAGVLLANCAIAEGRNASWLPSYGPEMRGGTANSSVILSPGEIGSPVVDNPDVLIAMNRPSLHQFEDAVNPGGVIVVNTSVIEDEVNRKDVRVLKIPATDMARDAGLIHAANVAMLAAYLLFTGSVSIDTLKAVIPLSLKKQEYLDVNMKLIEASEHYLMEHRDEFFLDS